MKYQDVQWEHGMKPEERKDDILMLTEAWSKERATYPHWYIPPYEVCTELSNKTSEVGLLQCYTGIDIDTMFAFCYELVWRYEKSMNSYSDYEVRNIHQIWNAYGESLAMWDKEELSDKRGSCSQNGLTLVWRCFVNIGKQAWIRNGIWSMIC